MAITKNDIKNISEADKKAKVYKAFLEAKKVYSTEKCGSKWKVLNDLCQFYATAVRLCV